MSPQVHHWWMTHHLHPCHFTPSSTHTCSHTSVGIPLIHSPTPHWEDWSSSLENYRFFSVLAVLTFLCRIDALLRRCDVMKTRQKSVCDNCRRRKLGVGVLLESLDLGIWANAGFGRSVMEYTRNARSANGAQAFSDYVPQTKYGSRKCSPRNDVERFNVPRVWDSRSILACIRNNNPLGQRFRQAAAMLRGGADFAIPDG